MINKSVEQQLQLLKAKKAQLLEQKYLAELRKNSWAAVHYVLSYSNPGFLPMAAFHKRWHQTVDLLKRNAKAIRDRTAPVKNLKTKALFICHRNSGKSFNLAIGRPLYELGEDPNLRIKIVCNAENRAYERVDAIKKHIEVNENVRKLWPHLKPQSKTHNWSRTRIIVERSLILPDPSVEGYGILTTSVGSRGDFIILDDVCDERNTLTYPKMRDQIKRIFSDVWLNVLEPWGICIVLGTPWHQDDLYGYIQDELKDEFLIVKDVIPKTLEPIWPEKMTKEWLIKKRNELKEKAFARAYFCEPISKDEVLFDFDTLEFCKTKGQQVGAQLGKKIEGARYFAGVDLASRLTSGSSRTCIFTVALLPDGTRVPVEVVVGHFTGPQTARLIIDRYNEWKHDLIFVENNSYQQTLLQWISDLGHSLPIEGYYTGEKKYNLNFGVPSLAIEFQNGMWAFPDTSNHPSDCTCGFCTFLQELSEYPIGKNDDTIMAALLAKEAIRRTYSGTADFSEVLRVYEISEIGEVRNVSIGDVNEDLFKEILQ